MDGVRSELRVQLGLAAPVALINLAMLGMGAVDTALMGRFSTDGMAAVSLGHSVFWVPASFGVGVLMSLDALVSQAHGARDAPAIARALQRGLLLALLLSLPIGLLLLASRPLLVALGQPPTLIGDASAYARLMALGLPALFLFVTLRLSLQAIGRLRTIMVVALLANGLNYVLDRWLIFGGLGVAPLGAVGSALATVACQWTMVGLLLLLARGPLGPHLRPIRQQVFAWAPLRRMLALGLPIGCAFVLETGAFNAVTVLMGRLGTIELAANRCVLLLATVSFMVPLGLSTAAAVRCGHTLGAGDPAGTRRAAGVSIGLTAGVMLAIAGAFLVAPRALVGLFSVDGQVVALAVSLLPLVAAFQLMDGLQVVAAGILRGWGDTRWPALANFGAYWLLALPLGAAWALRGGGPHALWWSLGGGLGLVALVLLARVRRQMARQLVRIDLERGSDAPPVPGALSVPGVLPDPGALPDAGG